MEKAIILFLFLFILSIFSMYVAAINKKESFLDRMTDKITIITGILAAFGIYLTYRVFQKQSNNMSNDITLRLIDRAWIGINKELATNSSKCKTLVNSLYFEWPLLKIQLFPLTFSMVMLLYKHNRKGLYEKSN